MSKGRLKIHKPVAYGVGSVESSSKSRPLAVPVLVPDEVCTPKKTTSLLSEGS
ncbi:MAG: hypothetical protein Q9M36_08535 [Sulfurovum sp.]|nr:hypothetical protein [Sulfurovum sp.]